MEVEEVVCCARSISYVPLPSHVARHDTLPKSNLQNTDEGGRHCSRWRKSWTVDIQGQSEQEMPALQQEAKNNGGGGSFCCAHSIYHALPPPPPSTIPHPLRLTGLADDNNSLHLSRVHRRPDCSHCTYIYININMIFYTCRVQSYQNNIYT